MTEPSSPLLDETEYDFCGSRGSNQSAIEWHIFDIDDVSTWPEEHSEYWVVSTSVFNGEPLDTQGEMGTGRRSAWTLGTRYALDANQHTAAAAVTLLEDES